jgi:hypothetical protein
MRRAALALVVVALLAGCHRSSNVARVDNLVGAQEEAVASLGGWLRGDPSYDSDEPATATLVVQWNRFKPDGTREPQAWLWERRLDDYWLNVDAWVLVYEVQAWRDGRVSSFYTDTQKWGVPADVERDAFVWAAEQP